MAILFPVEEQHLFALTVNAGAARSQRLTKRRGERKECIEEPS